MQSFDGKCAVITGAASGIGKALAFEAASLGLKLVLVDLSLEMLAPVEKELKALGAETLALGCDVSQFEQVDRMAKATIEHFGKVHLLFNNAGVSSAPKPIWESSLADWQWVMGVNLWGVIYGVKAFVPQMMAHGEEAHIINTASIAGLISNSRLNTYGVTKHAVVALSETLKLDLEEQGVSQVSVSVLCPAWIKTQIHLSERNRPTEFKNVGESFDKGTIKAAKHISQAVESGIEPQEAAKIVFEAIRNREFYILTHPPYKKLVRIRAEAILEGGPLKALW
ncbi:MAG: SDR family NAD(P)-dependent oxidoreductase [Deinococcales bacterium]